MRLAELRMLANERFRIARDIHDDFGARVTQISLVSSAAQLESDLSPKAKADFAAVTEMSRNLVESLYETVWAVSPENDHLDSVANFICKLANQMCAQASLRCRLLIPDLPLAVPVKSSLRHNLVMTIKEALHNVIKHAEATEVQIGIQFEAKLLTVEIKDNGKGFDPSASPHGNGLSNMARRMQDSGGRWTQESQPGHGTRIRLEIPLSANGGLANRHHAKP
jgi:signal transduction histidine kinase